MGIGLYRLPGTSEFGYNRAQHLNQVTLLPFNILLGSWGDIMPMVVTIVAFLAIAVMSKKGVKGSVFWGIIGGFALYYLLGLTVPGFYANLNIEMTSPLPP